MAAGVIYDGFKIDKHVVTKLPSTFERHYIGIDYGTNNPCVFLLIGKHARAYYVIKEYYYNGKIKGQKSPTDYGADLVKFIGDTKINKTFLDPSALGFKTELKKFKIYPKPADNEVLAGIMKTAAIIAENRLFIHASCKNTLKEFSSYIWDEKAATRGEDKPLKQNDHAMDALRYTLFSLEGKGAGLDSFKGSSVETAINSAASPVSKIRELLK